MISADRCLTILASGVLLILLLPVAAIIALLIVLDSKGGVFFVQERIGKGDRPFRIYKFRTMHAHLGDASPSPTDAQDPRVTRVGRPLRRVGLDELPQLMNILKGDMAFIGPRPQLASEMEAYIQGHEELLRERSSVRPGLTSPWCISEGQPKHKPSLEMLRSDCEYVRGRSLGRDGAVLCGTFLHLLRRL